MLDLGSLKLGIKVDSEDAKDKLVAVKKTVGETAKELKTSIVNGAKVAAAGFASLAGSAVALTESTREYRTEQAKLKTAFENSGLSAEAAKKTYSDLNSILGDSGQATEAANHLALLCNNEEELAQWTDICTGVYATFGDSLPIEGLTEAANETVKVGQVSGALADALNWVGISEDEFNEKLANCTTEQERQKLITDALTGAYQGASEQYKQNAADVIAANEANQRLQDTLASFGAILEPVITSVKEFAADGLERIGTFVENHQEEINSFVNAIKDFGNFIMDNAQIITDLLIGIGVGLAVFKAAGIVMSLVGAMQTLIGVIQSVGVAQGLLNVIMMANPIGIVIGLIAGLVTAFTLLWNHSEGFRNFWIGLWESIKGTVSGAIEKIKGIINIAGDMYQKGREMFMGLWEGIKSVWESIKNWVSEKVEWIKNKFSAVTGFFGGKDGGHRTGLREVPYDGYKAVLHKGEMVLTAAEANQYQNHQGMGNGVTNNIVVNNYSPEALDEAESARQFRRTQRELALGF